MKPPAPNKPGDTREAPTLIHLGLHKTASTSLQHTWQQMADVTVASPTFIMRLLDVLHGTFNRDTALDLTPLKDEPMFPSTGDDPHRWRIFSSEAYSVFKWLKTPPADVAKRYFDRQLDVFTRLCPNAHVLIVVREPHAWIKSVYMQYVKTGGTLTYRRFLLVHGVDLRAMLSVDRLKAIWGNRYGSHRVHILPFELFRDAPARFFDELHSRIGVPKPPAAAADMAAHLNVSLSPREGEFLRQTNKLMALFMTSETLDQASRDILRKAAPVALRAARTELQDAEHSLLARSVNRLVPAPDFGPLPDDMQDFIRDTFIPMLARETGDLCGVLDSYSMRQA
ncbi:sulfotransferase [Kordiimonas aestuarii]|uniref:sulfotransferase n=1 Tax=Kordiimonas aestuarii TaxID=1005925 RepID=UPI0021CE67D6|nr:sulfotransferase [Kordiimonas aestuarii]